MAAKPEPCPKCGNPIAWWRPYAARCTGCYPEKPPHAIKSIVVTEPDGTYRWAEYDKELAAVRERRGW